jgi:hypothetical protein
MSSFSTATTVSSRRSSSPPALAAKQQVARQQQVGKGTLQHWNLNAVALVTSVA